jgi:hypothetical protein
MTSMNLCGRMDGISKRGSKMNVQDQVEMIKREMPQTYGVIQREAARIGNEAYRLVKRALRGEPNCFWAMEGGHVVGTPFNQSEIQRDVAQHMVAFGCAYVCIFQTLPGGQDSGTN